MSYARNCATPAYKKEKAEPGGGGKE